MNNDFFDVIKGPATTIASIVDKQKRFPFYKTRGNQIVNLNHVHLVSWEFPEIRFNIPHGVVVEQIQDAPAFVSEVKRLIERLGMFCSDFDLTTEVKI